MTGADLSFGAGKNTKSSWKFASLNNKSHSTNTLHIMKNTLRLPILALFTILGAQSCSKESRENQTNVEPATVSNNQSSNSLAARYIGPDYSQSISVDSANSMIGSYLASVKYPMVDTAIRSITFDADTLRAYLQNNNIVTLKLMFAHRLDYKANYGGQYAGLNPNAMTVIVVGQDQQDNYVFNNRNEVYDNINNCPLRCGDNTDAYIH